MGFEKLNVKFTKEKWPKIAKKKKKNLTDKNKEWEHALQVPRFVS